MFCINCHYKSTYVTNSRPHKKEPLVWRRRSCPQCGFTVTTHETIVLEDYIQIDSTPFSAVRLGYSLAHYFTTDSSPADTAYWIAKTVGQNLIQRKEKTVSHNQLIEEVATTLKLYNARVSEQYALRYSKAIPTSKPRRKRPGLSRP